MNVKHYSIEEQKGSFPRPQVFGGDHLHKTIDFACQIAVVQPEPQTTQRQDATFNRFGLR